MADVLLKTFKLTLVAIMAGTLLYAVAGVPVSSPWAPCTLQRPHCAVAQVCTYLIGVIADCFVMTVAVEYSMFFDFAWGLLWALVAVRLWTASMWSSSVMPSSSCGASSS